MRVNYHCHSRCSMDAEHSMLLMAQAAIDAGLTQVCFTDHCEPLDDWGKPMHDFSWDDEERDFAEAAAALGSRIDLRLGVEMGEPTQDPAYAAEILSHRHLDFVIGSAHCPVNGQDYYFQHYQDPAACQKMLDEYLDQLLDIARSPYYDVLGHITYPLRYMRWRDGIPVDFAPHMDKVRALLRTVIDMGRGIELNTSGYLTCGGEPMPPREMLTLYRSLGGEIITVGSDAHVPARMAQGLDDGMALLRDIGFSYFTVFKDRKPEFIRL